MPRAKARVLDAPLTTTLDHAAFCPRCPRGVLELVQPSPDRPDLVVGTCPKCGRLYSVEDAAAAPDDVPPVFDVPPDWRVAGVITSDGPGRLRARSTA